ncbi:MAG: thiamine pyrophosphate-binding protein [Nitrososphaerales archaeon]
MKGADLLVRCLENEGVRYVFALPGEEIIDICDSLSKSSIESIIVRHEQTAAFMADVYGRLTGRAGVCLSTLGPGATNLTTGVADANLDRSPLVAITGQAEQEEIHKEFHQYIDIVHLFEPITKWNTRISKASVIPEITRKAFKIAEAEKPGACHFEVPRDVLNEESTTKPVTRETPKATGPNLSSVKRAVDIIKKSEYPLILAGNSVIRGRASKELCQFASSANIQVAETFMGKGSMSWEDKLFLSPIGLQMFDYVGCGLQRADIIIAIGYDFVEYAPKLWNPKRGKRIIHINALPAEVDSHYVPEVEVVGDIGLTLVMLSK